MVNTTHFIVTGFKLGLGGWTVTFKTSSLDETDRCLNEENLRIRIKNLTEQVPHLDLSAERAALAEIVKRNKST